MSDKTKVAIWIVLGGLVGFAFGAVTQNIGAWIGIGVAIGVAIGLATTRAKRK